MNIMKWQAAHNFTPRNNINKMQEAANRGKL